MKPKTENQTFEFQNDFVRSEFTNYDTDTDNIWEWEKGQKLNKWTDDTDWEIVKVEKYPNCGITLKRLYKNNIKQL